MLSLVVQTVNIRRCRLLPSYAVSVCCADGVPVDEIKGVLSRVHKRLEIFATPIQNRLTSQIVAPTMQTLTGTYVLVDKSEQAEEGARSFLLLWLV